MAAELSKYTKWMDEVEAKNAKQSGVSSTNSTHFFKGRYPTYTPVATRI